VIALTDTVTQISPSAEPVAAATGVVRLMLTDFRNYDHLRLETDLRPVVLAGANGAGKTNILEALSYLAPGRGLRGVRLSEAGRRAPAEDVGRPWAIAADVETPVGSVRLGTGLEPAATDRRAVHIDGKSARGAAALAQYVAVTWITPALDRLFTDTPGARRKFLDRLVTALDAEHASRCAAYDQALRRRTKLFRDGVTDAAWYEALEDTLCRYGVAIAAARRDVVNRLNAALRAEDGPFPAARIGLSGFVDDCLEESAAVDAEDALRDALQASRRYWPGDGEPPPAPGPNRSDVIVTMLKTARPAAECSTGEQKALLISIVLAHVKLQTETSGRAPLLLLDEVAAHLDPDRRSHLFGRLIESGTQTWLTGTDLAVFTEFGNAAQFLTVANGTLKPWSADPFVGGHTRISS
jgi:DNA replication and repair protein RecF